MKREYPVLWAAISKYVVNPLAIILSTFFISTYYVGLSTTELATICATAFGVFVSLASLAFAVKCDGKPPLDSSQFIYAGTKLSHASVLSLQLLLVVLSRHIITTKFADYQIVSLVASFILKIAWTFISSMTMWVAYWGISCLNTQFFTDWEMRIAKLNAAEEMKAASNQSAPPQSSKPQSKKKNNQR